MKEPNKIKIKDMNPEQRLEYGRRKNQEYKERNSIVRVFDPNRIKFKDMTPEQKTIYYREMRNKERERHNKAVSEYQEYLKMKTMEYTEDF